MTVQVDPPDTRIGCSDECGAKVEEPAAVGWTYLVIARRWRCPECCRALEAINERKNDEYLG